MSAGRLSKGFVLSILLCVGLVLPSFAQSPSPTVTVVVDRVTWSGYEGDEYGPRFRFGYTFGASTYSLFVSGGCLKYGAAQSGDQYPGLSFLLFAVDWSSPNFTFRTTSHEERKKNSDDCTVQGTTDITFNKPDKYEVEGTSSINLNTLQPGVYSSQFVITNLSEGSNVHIYFRVKYNPPPLQISSSSIPTSPTACANTDYSLTAGASRSYNNFTGVTYEWQARLTSEDYDEDMYMDCHTVCEYDMIPPYCYDECVWVDPPPVYNWIAITTSGSSSITFNPQTQVYRTRNPTSTELVYFRVRAVQGGTVGPWSDDNGFGRDVAPRAPTTSVTPTTLPSCNTADGQIIVTSVSSPTNNFLWLLKAGNVGIGCNPESDCFGGSNISGSGSGTSATITNVAGIGQYSLFLVNPGGSVGACYSKVLVNVSKIPQMGASMVSTIDLSCNGSKTGVSVSISSGKPSTSRADKSVTYSLTGINGTSFSQGASSNSNNATISFSNVPAGMYSMVASDGCTNNVTKPLTITEPVKVTVYEPDFTTGTSTCVGNGNGKMTVKAQRSAGVTTGPYFRFVLNKDGAFYSQHDQTEDTWTATDLSPGSYVVNVSEANGTSCNSTDRNFSISGPPDMAVTVNTQSDVICFGGNTGTLHLTGSGGSGEFDYRVVKGVDVIPDLVGDNGGFEGLTAGDYSLQVLNVKDGCADVYTRPAQLTIGQPTQISITLDKINISCSGESDGVITSTVSGGVPDATPEKYEYSWEWQLPSGFASMGKTTPNITGLDSALYRLTVTDDHACKMSSSVRVLEPAPLTIGNVKVNDIACLGETGTIVVTPEGGTPTFSYEYSLNGGSYQSFDATTPLGVGFYNVRAIDSRLCAIDDAGTYEITLPGSVLDVSLAWKEYNGFDVSCNGGANGEVTLTPVGGNGAGYTGYTFNKDADAYIDNTTLGGFTAGNHDVRVKDARGCIVTKNVTLTQPAALATIEAAKTHVDCFGAATGSMTLNVSGGVLPFKYQLESGPQQDEPLFESLVASNYTFTITDDNSCTIIYQDQIVNLNQPIVIEPTLVDAQCFDASDGTIDLSVSGGVAPYQYFMAGAPVTSFIEELHQGTYEILVVDDKGCEMPTGDLVINHPDLLEITAVDLHDIVCKDQKGTIEMTSIGGTLPYTYEYSKDGDPYVVFTETTPLVDDTYNVRVTDAHNCRTFYTDNVVVTNPPTPVDFTFELKEYNGFNISCFGGSNGVITVAPSGGNGFAYTKYFFAVDGGTFQEQPKLEHLTAGDHTIFVHDERGCVITKDTYLTESSEALTAGISNQINARCFNEANGELEVAALGGTLPYTYAIDAQLSFQDTPSFKGLALGDYVIIVADINDCRTTVPATILSINPAMLLSKEVKDVNCFAGSDGKIDLTITGGVSPFAYTWDKGQPPQASISGLKKDTYTVTIVDAANCKIVEPVAVSQPAAALTISSITTTAACWEQSNGSLTAFPAGGTAPYVYSIDNGSSYQASATFAGAVGPYTVFVKDANACTTSSPTDIKQRNDPPQVNFLAATENYALDTLVITEINVPKPDSLNWIFDPAALVISDDQWNPQLKFAEAGNYTTTMISYFADCAYSLTKNLALSPYDPDRKPDNTPGYKPIVSMTVTPNPSTGKFSVSVKLNSLRHLSINVYDVTGMLVDKEYWSKTKEVEWPVDISSLPAGLYVVRAVTEPDAEEIKVIINK